MLTSLLYSPGTIIAAIVLLALIIFTVVPDLADKTAAVFNTVSRFFKDFAAARWAFIVSIWSFSGEKGRQQRRIDRDVQAEIATRFKQRLSNGRAAASKRNAAQPTPVVAPPAGVAPMSANGATPTPPAPPTTPSFASAATNPAAQTTVATQSVGVMGGAVATAASAPAAATASAPTSATPATGASSNGASSAVASQLVPPDEMKLIIEGVTALHGGPAKDPESSEIAQAWVRRITYLALVLVCAAADYVLASSRTPLLFGNGATPSWLVFLFRYLQIITGILFVSIAILSGMIIQEFIDKDLADVVKLSPNLQAPAPKIFLGLAILMFICDIVVIVSLTIAGIDFTYGIPVDVAIFFVIFIGTTIIIALALLLGFQGLLDGFMGLGSLIVLGALALVAIVLQLVTGFIAAIFSFLAALRNWQPGPQAKAAPRVEMQTRDLAVIGYGDTGSAYAVGICEQLGQIRGRKVFAWVAGFAAKTPREKATLSTALARTKAVGDAERVVASNFDDLARGLVRHYETRRDVEKPLLFVVSGNDLTDCLPTLKTLGQASQIKNIKLVILWIVPQATGPMAETFKQTAQDLNQWASENGSILMTTIVVERGSPLMGSMATQAIEMLQRSLASLLIGATAVAGEATSFLNLVKQFNDKKQRFVELASIAVGVDPSISNWKALGTAGLKGQINPDTASIRLQAVARLALGDVNELWTVNDEGMKKPGANPSAPDAAKWGQQQAMTYINVIKHPLLLDGRPTEEFVNEFSVWLNKQYAITADRLTVEQLYETGGKRNAYNAGLSPNTEDAKGEPVKWGTLKGACYFHFTSIRGVTDDTGAPAIPQALRR